MKQAVRNHTIDLLKLLFSFGIIAIHLHLFDEIPLLYYSTTQSLLRIGVPFFFIVSGYYFAPKTENRDAAYRYLKRLIRIYVTFEAIDLILSLSVNRSLLQSPLLIIQKVLTCGVNGIYWYLISLILTCFMLKPLWAKKKTVLLIGIGLILYLLAMTDDSYAGFFAGTALRNYVHLHTLFWRWPQAGFAQSVLYLSIGVLIRQKQIRIPHTGIFFLTSLVCLISEAFFTQTHGAADANCYLSLLFAAPLLFLWADEHPALIRCPDEVRDLSLYVYMIHIYCNYLTYPLPGILRFPVSALLSALISLLLIRLKNTRNTKKKDI